MVRRWSKANLVDIERRLRRGDALADIADHLGITYTALRGVIHRHGLSGLAKPGRRPS